MGLYVVVSILIFIVCLLLVLIVLVQNSKGGGLASNFSSSNQFMGVRKTADFLEKSTWILAIALLLLSMVSVLVIPRGSQSENVESAIKEQVDANANPVDYSPAPEKK